MEFDKWDIEAWTARSRLKEVCGIFGCNGKPAFFCSHCNNWYCPTHSFVLSTPGHPMAQHQRVIEESMAVNIFMSTYNRAHMVVGAIENVIAQICKDWTLTVIEDCSQDNTKEVLQSLAGLDSRIKLIFNKENQGSLTKQSHLMASTGKYLAILDDDDLWKPDYLDKLVGALEQDPGCEIAYSDAWRVYPDGKKKYWDSSLGRPFPNILPSCSIYRGDTFRRTGGWDIEHFRYYHTEADYYFRVGWPKHFIHIPEPLVYLGTPPKAMSSNKKLCADYELILIDKHWKMLQSNKKVLGELYARVALHYAEAGQSRPTYFIKAIQAYPKLIEAYVGLFLILINRDLFLLFYKLYRKILGYV